MFAHVIPLKRTPRAIDRLTYLVPEAYRTTIAPGHLVTVPFRTGDLFALVLKVDDEEPASSVEFKELNRIVIPTPLCSPRDLARMVELSALHHVALGVVAKLMMPPLQKRKLAAQSVIPLSSAPRAHSTTTVSANAYATEDMHGELLRTTINGSTLILVPEEHDIACVYDLLPADLQTEAMTWHSTLSQKEQFARWFAIRNAEKRIVIGTRSSLFLPWQKLDTIIIDFEHDENHKHWDQFPRYDVRVLAEQYAEDFGATITRLSYCPSIESYYRVHTGAWTTRNDNQPVDQIPTPLARTLLATTTRPGLTIVDMRDERRGKNFSLFGNAVEEAIAQATEDIFVYVPRRGYASSVGCHDCGFVFQCSVCHRPLIYHDDTRTLRCHYCAVEEPMILTCPKCRSVLVNMRGGGTELVHKTIQTLVQKTHPHEIIRVDSDSDMVIDTPRLKPRIIIGTQKAMPIVDWQRTGLVILVGIDDILGLPELYATEEVWQRVMGFCYRRRQDSQLMIQTYHRDHVIFKSLAEPDRLYRTELRNRKEFHYPPYAGLVRYIASGSSEETALANAHKLRVELEKKLTTSQISAMLEGPIMMSPGLHRGQYRAIVIAKIETKNWHKGLAEIHESLQNPCQIDPYPLTLLSP